MSSKNETMTAFEKLYVGGSMVGVSLVFLSGLADVTGASEPLWSYTLSVLLGNLTLGVVHRLWSNYRHGGAPRDSIAVQFLDIDPDGHPGVRDEEDDS